MSLQLPEIGMFAHRTFEPRFVLELARRLDRGGAGRLWVIEDCFYTAGVSLAAAALAATGRLNVGLGILPAVVRNPAVTAMEIATLCGLAPGRVLPGIGHGVQEWMHQIGARTPSPVTTLAEVLDVVGRLLAGERVSVQGREVRMRDVVLEQPPADPPPLLAGVRGPRSLEMAGRVAGGVVLAEPATPSVVREAVRQASPCGEFRVAAYVMLGVAAERREAYRRMAPWLGGVLEQRMPALRAWPFHDELAEWYHRRGVDGLAEIPPDWWAELGAIGTLDDAVEHVHAVGNAGAHHVGLVPEPEEAVALAQLDDVLALARA